MKPEKSDLSDPLIDEVRERRRQLWADYDNDLDKVCEAIRRLEAQHPNLVADGPPTRRTAEAG